MGTLITWVLNFVLGIVVTALVASQISSGQSVSFADGIKFNLRLYNFGLILYVVLIVAYFWGAKKFLGKTIGGLLTQKLLGKKK